MLTPEILMEQTEDHIEAEPWIENLISLGKNLQTFRFQAEVKRLVFWSLKDPIRRPVAKLVVREVGKQVPEIALTLQAIMDRKI